MQAIDWKQKYKNKFEGERNQYQSLDDNRNSEQDCIADKEKKSEGTFCPISSRPEAKFSK